MFDPKRRILTKLGKTLLFRSVVNIKISRSSINITENPSPLLFLPNRSNGYLPLFFYESSKIVLEVSKSIFRTIKELKEIG